MCKRKGEIMEIGATLFEFRRHLGLAAGDTGEDDRLLLALEAATAHVEQEAGRYFSPRQATMHHTLPAGARELVLRGDLLELAGMACAEGDLPLGGVRLFPEVPPHTLIDWPLGMGKPAAGLIAVSGVWGWHDDWARAWRASGCALTAAADPAAAELAVSAIDAVWEDGVTPRLQIGALLRVGGEFLRLLAIDSLTERLTVERGAGNTTPEAHDLGASIAIYQPPRLVTTLVLRRAAWLLGEPDGLRTPDSMEAAAAAPRRAAL